VVSELATGHGKTKSSRRRKRLNSGLSPSALTGYKKLAVAILLTCSLGGGIAHVAYAATGETTGDNLYYSPIVGNYSINNRSVFNQYQDGWIYSGEGTEYKTPSVITSTAAQKLFALSNPAGSKKVLGSASYTTWASALGYSAIVVQMSDSTKQNIAAYGKYATLFGAINDDYWRNPAYAQEISDAFTTGDLSKLVHMPRLYGVDSSGNEIQLAMSDMVFSSSNKTIPSTPGVKPPTYSSVAVDAGSVWQPMDRLLVGTNPVTGTYTIKNGLTMNSDGTFTPKTITSINYGMNIIVDNGGVTKLEDPTVITVADLTVGKGGTVDLTHANTVGGASSLVSLAQGSGYYSTGLFDSTGNPILRQLNRGVIADHASLADGTVFRLGSYPAYDSVYIVNATTPDDKAKLYIELGYVAGMGTATQGEVSERDDATSHTVVLGILNGAEKFEAEGRVSLVDGVLGVYEITPVIGKLENNFTDPDGGANKGTGWYLKSYSYIDTGMVSESGQTAADNTVILNNQWKSNYLNMFRRVGSLHRQGFTEQRVAMLDGSAPVATANNGAPGETGSQDNTADTSRTMGIASYPVPAEDQKENAWAEVWHGKYQSSSGYGRQVDQSYNGMQVGYDKLLNNKLYNGKVYNGFFLSKIEGDSHTATGGGDQDSEGLGIYASWVGNKGHYLDTALMVSRLTNDYHLIGRTGDGFGQVTGKYATWAYGLGLQYGYQSPADQRGWYWEPSAALFLGRTDSVSYGLSNDLGIRQDDADSVTGRLGLKVGKQLAGGQGTVYAGVAALHEFAGGTGLHALYGDQSRLLEGVGGKDTWWEWSLGGNWKISPSGVFNLDLNKTTGGSDGNTWRVNGGLNWTWGGFWGGTNKGKLTDIAVPETTTALVVGHSPAAAEVPVTADADPDKPATVPIGSADATEYTPADEGGTAGTGTLYYTPASGEYSFAPITVEAARPDWEKKLSPGQVSVIYPAEFEGEQKDLPDLLDRVPGLFVQRVSGDGHYTVARVRGSTGAQVNVYVDGVLMNLNGEAAVNLSTIPVDNIERIEVYRGYVPARFSGSPLGGVINIITKKPKELGGTITQGIKSYGGYTGTYQFTAPAGDGSLMATWQRDIWTGDFPFMTKSGHYVEDSKTIIIPPQKVDRRSNGYQNENGMVKWQDDHWTVKAAWKDLHEQLPRAVDNLQPGLPNGLTSNTGGYVENFHKGYYDAELNTSQKEFQIGRRATVGNLDWGWKTYYLNQKKDYRNTGIYKYGADTGENVDKKYDYIPGFNWTQFDSDKWGINLNGAMKMGGGHLVEMNFDYSDESMDADGSHWDDWNKSTTIKYSKNRQYIHNYKIKEYHLTLQDSITLNQAGDFKLTPVLRADRVDMSTMASNDMKWKYSGAAALQKQLNEHWSLKTNWGTYNRHPNFYELFGDGATIAPNERAAKYFDLDGQGTWESGTQFDFGVNWQGKLVKADTDTSLTWFQRRSENQFALWQPNVPNAPGTYFPMDEARVHGLELTHSMKWHRVGLDLSGTWQKSEYSDNTMGGTFNGVKSYISYTPEWVWNVRLDYLFPGDKLDIFAEYHYTDTQFVGFQNSTASIESNFIDSLSTVNLGAKYSFGNGWKLSAGVNDVFNKGYEARQIITTYYPYVTTPRAYPLPGRMYYATMEYKF
jgi:outer membrane autotransporter protein